VQNLIKMTFSTKQEIAIVVNDAVTTEYEGVYPVAFYLLAVNYYILDTDPDY
jgi:hypothetical protein